MIPILIKIQLDNLLCFKIRDQDGTENFQHALVWAVDDKADLAILHLLTNFSHGYLEIAEESPKILDPVYSCGMPGGLSWSVLSGTLQQKRLLRGQKIYEMGMVGSVGGLSGAPIVNYRGEIISLADAVYHNIPSVVIGVSVGTIKQFVIENRLF